MNWTRICALGLLAAVCSPASGGANGYLGSDVCAGCHKEIARTQAQTNMARTWQGVGSKLLTPDYRETHEEGPAPFIEYSAERKDGTARYRVAMPGQAALEFPVESVIGGKRHAVTFLFRIATLDGMTLPRAPLVEGRYIHSMLENGLALELGFPEEKPANYETALGRVLTPNLEQRCLSCHTAPRQWGARMETGVACESCHGPGQAHLAALAAHSKDLGILNPGKLPVAEKMRPCSQCHAGSGAVEDPLAGNLLISDQVTALKNSECWRQSGGRITCTDCHNPHEDAPRAVLVARSEKTCLRCHSAVAAGRAALCPVNRTGGCAGCHMPNQIHGVFHLANHWIAVHPEQKTKVPAANAAWRSTVAPKHMYLRAIVLNDRAKAPAIRRRILQGESFFDLAQANSVDEGTKAVGGYLGDLTASQIDPQWSRTLGKLAPGELGEIEANGKYFLVQRMPRNFREEAEAKVNEAETLRKEGKPQEAVAALFDALKIYPYFLRALTYLGILYGGAGDARLGAQMLEMATRLYPRDQGAHFNLGIAYGALGRSEEEIAEYKKTLEIDEDYVPAYLNWGGALYKRGEYEEAIQLYRKGAAINPLSASLHYSLSVALEQMGKKGEAEAEMRLAAAIDRKYAGR